MPFFNAVAETAPASASTAPTDRSIPPERITSVKPIERHKLTEICRRTFQPFSAVRKRSLRRLSATTSTSNASSD